MKQLSSKRLKLRLPTVGRVSFLIPLLLWWPHGKLNITFQWISTGKGTLPRPCHLLQRWGQRHRHQVYPQSWTITTNEKGRVQKSYDIHVYTTISRLSRPSHSANHRKQMATNPLWAVCRKQCGDKRPCNEAKIPQKTQDTEKPSAVCQAGMSWLFAMENSQLELWDSSQCDVIHSGKDPWLYQG